MRSEVGKQLSVTLSAARIMVCLIILCAESSVQAMTFKVTQIGPRNFWAGGEAAYSFGGNEEFADNFQAAVQPTLQVWHPSWLPERLLVPFKGSFARLSSSADTEQRIQTLRTLATSAEGISISFVPSYQFGGEPQTIIEGYGATTWLSIGWRMNTGRDAVTDSTVYLHQFRASVGVEFSIGDLKPSEKPATLAVEGVWTDVDDESFERVAGAGADASLESVEMTFILPILSDMGVMVERIVCSETSPIIRAGLVFAPTK